MRFPSISILALLASSSIKVAHGFSTCSGPHPRLAKSWLTRTTTTSSSALFVSVGLGPKPGAPKEEETEDYFIKSLSEMPVTEEARTERMTQVDRDCDAWFASLLGDTTATTTTTPFPEYITKPIRDKLFQQVMPQDCSEEVVWDRSDELWTPYGEQHLIGSVFRPPFGLENYGIPIPRRGAEAWRHFDVGSMVTIDYGNLPNGYGECVRVMTK